MAPEKKKKIAVCKTARRAHSQNVKKIIVSAEPICGNTVITIRTCK